MVFFVLHGGMQDFRTVLGWRVAQRPGKRCENDIMDAKMMAKDDKNGAQAPPEPPEAWKSRKRQNRRG